MSDSTVVAAMSAGSAAPRRSRAGLWIAVVALVVVLMIAGSCGLMTWAVTSGGGIPNGDAVAVIYIDKQIAGVGSDGLTGGSSITPEEVISQLREADKDSSVKAIILRIDSPGGTASASTEIAIEVARARKPVIASIGDMGASGAYMIASQCDLIMCTPASDVGSIGVILGVTDLSDLYKKLGVKFTYLHEGVYKDAGGSQRPLTATETAMFQADIHLVYEQFIDIVAKGRKMDVAKVEKLATGWAWPGAKAKDLGLVDKLGNYRDAVQEAGRLGKIDGEPRIVSYRDESLGALLGQIVGTLGLSGPFGANLLGGSGPVVR
jgi:protease-4